MNKKIIMEHSKNHQGDKHCMKNSMMAFISGGFVGIFAQGCKYFYMHICHVSDQDAGIYAIVTVIALATIATGVGIYNKIAQHCGAGLFIPISGFSNALTSSALEGKSEGLIYGIGSKMFMLAGSVITYGIVSALIFGSIRYIFFGG